MSDEPTDLKRLLATGWRPMKDDPTRNPICKDCGVNTEIIAEEYMLLDDVWRAAHPDEAGMLCVGCFEARLGRTLRRADFTRYMLSNFDDGMPASERLKDRLRLPA